MLALIALALKLIIAFNTFGSNDVISFYRFGSLLTKHGLQWMYQNDIAFNHPPLIAYYLELIYRADHIAALRDFGITFPFLLRMPGIIADFLVVLVLLRLRSRDQLVPWWALLLLALSPVSLMISGFHGNTDSVMVMFLVFAAYMCLRDQPILCGICLALSCQVKIIPCLFLPIIFFFWLARGAAVRFAMPFLLLCITMWAEPLFKFPTLFLNNVLAYGSFWGGWGISYWLRLTHWQQFDGTGAFNQPAAVRAVALALKLGIVLAILLIAWRRRYLSGRALLDSIAYAWIVFFVFSPGISAQYMVWLAPFVLILWPTLYAWLVATSSVFLFFFYNSITDKFPWYIAVSTNKLHTLDLWTPWTTWPWLALILGMILLWKRAASADSSLRLFSFQPLSAETRE